MSLAHWSCVDAARRRAEARRGALRQAIGDYVELPCSQREMAQLRGLSRFITPVCSLGIDAWKPMVGDHYFNEGPPCFHNTSSPIVNRPSEPGLKQMASLIIHKNTDLSFHIYMKSASMG